jgi:dTDP-4-amino-4,6-dideoxygalactose transaminase
VIEPVIAVGATPVLVEKAVNDYGPDLKGLKAAVNSKTKAIIAVHMLGLSCDMDPILELARKRTVSVIEDASQAQGALYRRPARRRFRDDHGNEPWPDKESCIVW